MPKKYINQTDELIDKLGNGLQAIGAALWRERDMTVPAKDVNFYDYDGSRVYSYTLQEFALLTALPGNPVHEGLTAQGWNWTLSDAQEYAAAYGSCEIGQSYVTNDGKTRLYITVGETEKLTVNLNWHQSTADGVTLDWGDGSDPVTPTAATTGTNAGLVHVSHTYAAAGDYVITLTVAEGTDMRLGTNATNSDTITPVNTCFISAGNGYAGSGKAALQAVEIGTGVTALANNAFFMSTNLETVTIPTSVTTIYSHAFCGCFRLLGLNIPLGVTAINQYTAHACYHLRALCLPTGILTIAKSAFSLCTELERASVPTGATSLAVEAFKGCSSARRIAVPATVTSMGVRCFYNCYELEKIQVPGVTTIPDYCYMACHNARELTISSGVTKIGKGAFRSTFGFLTVTIPATVTAIDEFAFLYSDGTAEYHVLATTPPTLEPTAISGGAIYVPWSADHSVLNAYLAATGWSSMGDSIREEAAPDWWGEMLTITVAKAWVNSDESTTWPEGAEVAVQLTAGGEPVEDAEATLTADATSHAFTVHKYDGSHNEVTYSATETAVEGYTGSVGELTSGTITITNTADAPEEPAAPEEPTEEPGGGD